jgi:predicted nucleic acid-binding protein
MEPAVCNATPLIYLAKVGRLDLLRLVFVKVLIPEEVRHEVVDEGRRLGKADASVVEAALQGGWIEAHQAKPIRMPIALHQGEEAVISLAKEKGIRIVVMDEPSARLAARLCGLEPRGTLYVLLEALKRGELNLEELLGILGQLVEKGYRLREEVYLEVVRRARVLAEGRDPAC